MEVDGRFGRRIGLWVCGGEARGGSVVACDAGYEVVRNSVPTDPLRCRGLPLVCDLVVVHSFRACPSEDCACSGRLGLGGPALGFLPRTVVRSR